MEDFLTTAVVIGGILTGLRMWLHRPAAKQLGPPPTSAAIEARLERLETAIEAMTVEIERVTEGQRFTTKLLSDMHDSNRRIAAGR